MDWKQLFIKVTKDLTHVRELVHEEAYVVGVLYASGEGVGGVRPSGKLPFEPKVWHVQGHTRSVIDWLHATN